MPKLKPNPNDIEGRLIDISNKLTEKVRLQIRRLGKNRREVIAAARISQNTYYTYLRDPKHLTMSALLRIGTNLKFTDEDYIDILGLKENK